MSYARPLIQDVEEPDVSSWTMTTPTLPSPGFRFGVFEVNARTGELRKDGRLIHLRNQPFQVLTLLLDRAGDLVTREEIKSALWAGDADVDVEQGLNYCIKEIRSALADNAEAPRFVQTLPRRGYRFLGEVRRVPAPGAAVPAEIGPTAAREGQTALSARPRLFALAGVISLFVLLGIFAVLNREPAPRGDGLGRVRLVVLPFVDLSENAEGYLAEGLTDELIGSLGRLTQGRLDVIARSTSLAYRLRKPDPGAFARELGAAYFIEGTVRREGEHARVSVALARATDGTQLWSETYDRGIGDLLALEREVAGAIAGGVRVAVSVESGRATAINSEAYLAYLRGRFLWNQRSRASLLESQRIFAQLTNANPDFAPGFAGLADSYVVLMDHGHVSPSESWIRARAAAEKAVALDPGLSEAWTTLGMIRGLYEWNATTANEAFERAAALNPNYSTRLHWQAILFRAEGQDAAALENLRAARVIDPLSHVVRNNLAGVLVGMGRPEEALAEAESVVSIAPNWAPGLLRMAEALAALKRHGEADAAYLRAAATGGVAARADLAAYYAASGKRDQAAATVAALEKDARTTYVAPYLLAKAVAGLDPDRAFAALEAAFEERSPYLRLLRRDPDFEPLRNDERFDRLLRVLWPDSPGR